MRTTCDRYRYTDCSNTTYCNKFNDILGQFYSKYLSRITGGFLDWVPQIMRNCTIQTNLSL